MQKLNYQISGAIRQDNDSALSRFVSLQYALYINCFVLVLGGFAFVYTAFFIVQDVNRCKQESHGKYLKYKYSLNSKRFSSKFN